VPTEPHHESSWAKASWALVYYVIIPTCLIETIMWRFPELSREHFYVMLRWVLGVGILIVGVNALRANHAPGTLARLGLDSAYVAGTIGWLLGILGGDTVLDQSWQGHPFSIDIGRLFAVVASLASLNLVYYIMRFRSARPTGERARAMGLEGAPAPGPVTIEQLEQLERPDQLQVP